MLAGLNITSFVTENNFKDPKFLKLIDLLYETNCTEYRIPFNWRLLEIWEGEKSWYNEKIIDRYSRIIELLPPQSNVLATLVAAPISVSIEYFHDQSCICQKFSNFISKVFINFPKIKNFEVWNEPNASDFYLSVKTDQGHRPWTASEFMRDIFLPGATAVRHICPDATICLAGVAENGLVGHGEKKPALANQLPDDNYFIQMRSKRPHGRLYFAPNFLTDLIAETKLHLKSHYTKPSQLINALAFHPYPYFRIMQDKYDGKKSLDLTQRSIEISKDFFAATKQLANFEVQYWVTEFGARSLDVANDHFHNELQQRTYMKDVFNFFNKSRFIDRAYWYKFEDRDWEMTQEKTFGIVDNNGSRKTTFLDFSEYCTTSGKRLNYLGENFEASYRTGLGGFHSRNWLEETDSIFSYCAIGMSPLGTPVASVSPGRVKGNWWQVTSKQSITLYGGGLSEFRMGYIPPSGGGAKISLHVNILKVAGGNLFSFVLTNHAEHFVVTTENTCEKLIGNGVSSLRTIAAKIEKNKVTLDFTFTNTVKSLYFFGNYIQKDVDVKLRLKIVSEFPVFKQSKPGYCQIHSVSLKNRPVESSPFRPDTLIT